MTEEEVESLPRITGYLELSLIEAVSEAAGVPIAPEVGDDWYRNLPIETAGRAATNRPDKVILIKVDPRHSDEVRAGVERALAVAEQEGANIDGEEYGTAGLTVFVYASDVPRIYKLLCDEMGKAGLLRKGVSISIEPAG